jgi:hypothetical protein
MEVSACIAFGGTARDLIYPFELNHLRSSPLLGMSENTLIPCGSRMPRDDRLTSRMSRAVDSPQRDGILPLPLSSAGIRFLEHKESSDEHS